MSTLPSNSPPQPSASDQRLTANRSPLSSGWMTLGCGVILLLAHLPLVSLQFVELTYHPLYRSFPLILAGSALLAWGRWPERMHSGRAGISHGLFAAAWLLLGIATLLGSPWLGVLAAMGTLASCAYAWGGTTLLVALLPAWAFLWFLIPPPLGLDDRLLLGLRGYAAGASSGVLDLLGVLHVLSGNVIEIRGQRFLVDEACSGIYSFFALVPLATFYVLWTRRPAMWAALVILAAAGWALVANIVRIIAVALITTQANYDVSRGWPHELLGLVIYAFALGLLVSTDRLIGYLTVDLWSSPKLDEPLDTGPAPPDREPADGDRARLAVRPLAMSFGGLALLNLALVGLTLRAGSWSDDLSSAVDVTASDLPPTIGEWERRDFSTIDRQRNAESGEHSRTWRYRWRDKEAFVSVDFPFRGWHDLTTCYRSQGWRITGRRSFSLAALELSDPALADGTTLEMTKPFDTFATVWFITFDAGGTVIRPRLPLAQDGLFAGVYRRIRESGLLAGPDHASELSRPSYQVQLCVFGDAPATEDERQEMWKFMRQVVRLLSPAQTAESGSPP